MPIGAMFGDIARALFKKPVTEKYPFNKKDSPSRLRGMLHYDSTKCIGCMMCVRDCPANAIDIITVDKATKKYVMKYYYGRCTFCNQCVQSCRFGCIQLSNDEWELAALDTDAMVVDYGRPEDLQTLVDRAAQASDSEGEAQSG